MFKYDNKQIARELNDLSVKWEKVLKTIELLKKQEDSQIKWAEDASFLKSKSYKDAEENIIKQIEIKKKEVEVQQKEVDSYNLKIKAVVGEQKEAQKNISKKLIKFIYKALKNDSDKVLISLMEIFTAILMIKDYASPIDVELYLRNFDGINIAMNWFSPDRYNGKLA